MAGAALQFSWQAQHLVILSLQLSWQAQHLVILSLQFSWQVQHLVILSLQFSWQAQHLVILSLQFSWQAQHLVTLEWKELSRACGEMLNRNVEINVMLWFSAQGLGENANRNVEVARKKIVLFFFQRELTLWFVFSRGERADFKA